MVTQERIVHRTVEEFIDIPVPMPQEAEVLNTKVVEEEGLALWMMY